MYETPAEMDDLQTLLDSSIAQAGAFCESARARHLARRPAASLTYFEGVEIAVLAHGEVHIIGEREAEFPELDTAWVQTGRESPSEWGGTPVYLRLEPATLYTYARRPDRLAG